MMMLVFEYITSLNSFDDAMLITTSMEIPGQVASPLKYSIMVVYQDNIGNMDQKIWSEFTNDYLYGYSVIINQQKDKWLKQILLIQLNQVNKTN